MAVAGAHSVSVDALCLDATAPSPLNCFVYPEYQWTVPLGKMLNQKRQQNSAQPEGRPHGAIENVMVLCKAVIVVSPMTLSAEVMVRLRGARMTPTSNT